MRHVVQELRDALESGVLTHRERVTLGDGVIVNPERMARIILTDYERVRRAAPGGWLVGAELDRLHDDLLCLLSVARTPSHQAGDQGIAPWRRTIAALVYDSQRQRPVAGARAVVTTERRLLFETDDLAIDLEVDRDRTTRRLRLLGQIMADQPHRVPAWVIATGASGYLETETDDLGQFALEGLVAGTHRLVIGLTHDVIELPMLQL